MSSRKGVKVETIERRLLEIAGIIPKREVKEVLRDRMNELGITEVSKYLKLYESNEEERLKLAEGFLIQESYFMREKEHFRALAKLAADMTERRRKINLLSLGCASGEEAYSAAFVLFPFFEKGIRVSITGVDLSQKAIERAWNAIYGKRKLRGLEPYEIRKYFDKVGKLYRVKEKYRKLVSFKRGNILKINPSEYHPKEFVFLRNVLMHMLPEARRKALKAANDILSHQGFLFLGTSEFLEGIKAGLERIQVEGTLVFKKPKLQKKLEEVGEDREEIESLISYLRNKEWEMMREHAQTICSKDPLNPKAYFLLGVACEALGEIDRAIESFKEAIYLEPNFLLSFLYLAFLYEQKGEIEKAVWAFCKVKELLERGISKDHFLDEFNISKEWIKFLLREKLGNLEKRIL